jgi:hypothetical protein
MAIKIRTAMLACEALLCLINDETFGEFSEEAQNAYGKACDELWATIPEECRGMDWQDVDK